MSTEYPEIFRALAAPFRKDQERTRPQGDRTLTYITARAVMNRLDEVMGPENWWPHYEETKDGIKCTITMRMPDGREVSKEDGGGFATSMKAEDDVEKSGFSDALKRAGVTWGIGRYLYQDGVPRYDMAESRSTSRPRPAKPQPPGIAYREWLERYCAIVNEKWGYHLQANGEPPKDLVTIFQVNYHLLKALSTPAPKGVTKGEALKLGEDAWEANHQAMDVEATAYCRDEWKKAVAALKAKAKPKPREPGADDGPTPDEEAALDRMAGKGVANGPA